jgi:hypothetical protein
MSDTESEHQQVPPELTVISTSQQTQTLCTDQSLREPGQVVFRSLAQPDQRVRKVLLALLDFKEQQVRQVPPVLMSDTESEHQQVPPELTVISTSQQTQTLCTDQSLREPGQVVFRSLAQPDL